MNKSKALQQATLGGSLLAAITASLCCIGPLLAMVLGAGGFAASALFEKWRPLFLGVTFVLLSVAWYLTYWKPKAAWAEGSACATKPVSQWNKMVLWFATSVVLLMAAFPSLSSAILRATQTNPPIVVADASSVILKVKIPSMECAACAIGIQEKLRQKAGVMAAQVSYDTKEAAVHYNPTKISSSDIISTIDGTGYKAEPTNTP
jgi:copper chaperone CopZ